MLLAYSPNDGPAEMILSGVRRKAGYETLAWDRFKEGQEIHTWITFISDDRQQISASTYVGEISV